MIRFATLNTHLRQLARSAARRRDFQEASAAARKDDAIVFGPRGTKDLRRGRDEDRGSALDRHLPELPYRPVTNPLMSGEKNGPTPSSVTGMTVATG